MFAKFILILFYGYDRVTISLCIRYPEILLGEGYNWYLYAYRLFCMAKEHQHSPRWMSYPILQAKPSTHRMYDLGSNVPRK
jgi:hypothetical protein